MPKYSKTLEYILQKFNLSLQKGLHTEIPDTDRVTLAELFKELGFKKGVEIGVEKGEYSEVICAANPKVELFCVDAWKTYDDFSEHKTQSKLDGFMNEAKVRLEKYNVKFIRKFSKDAVKDFKDESLDFVYIDGNHKYDYVMEDITSWSKKVRPGGIVSGHDFRRHKNSLIEVVEAVTDYATANNIHLFVFGRKQELPGEKRDKHRSWMYIKSDAEKTSNSMLGKWDKWYKNATEIGSFRYGDTITYKLAAEFLKDIDSVEDWGCGTGGFKRFYKGRYTGVDGSHNPFVDKVADLCEYQSNTDGIIMRHVLEHNYNWDKVLGNAMKSFRKKFCLILFTPFQAKTGEIAHNKKHGVDVPDIAFAKEDIERHFEGFIWRMESHKTKTGYGIEHIYFIEKVKPKIAVISANLNNIDKRPQTHVSQSVPYDNYLYTDANFPPRFNAMTPRLQAKIPKCFGWQMAPDYDYYLWLDSSISLSDNDSLKYFLEQCSGYDIVVFKHARRPDVRQEARYIRKGIKQGGKNLGSIYIIRRYQNELLKEEMEEINANSNFKDDLLVNGGVFMYKNTPEVQQMLKEWWYHISRYIIQDQIPFAYVLKTSGIKIKVIPDVFSKTKYLKYVGHRHNSK